MTKISKYLEMFTNEKDSGRFGKAFELALREDFSGRKQNAVKSQGKTDAIFTFKVNDKRKSVTVEIKTACGEIEMADKAQFIVYCPDVSEAYEAKQQGYVFSREEWRGFINGYTGRGSFTRVSTRGHIHIQSFRSATRPKASQPIADYIWDCCYNQPTAEEWIAEMRGV